MTLPLVNKLHIHYPSSDGKRMADNTRQWNWMTFIKNGLEETTAGQNIFVAGDLLWYPVEGSNKIRVAPDVMVAIGRPKGDRNSYLQWREAHITPQIVFEILSPGNTIKEMENKLLFYEKYGVVEYYVYDPDFNRLEIYNRKDNNLLRVDTKEWISPLLKFKLKWTENTLEIFHPDDSQFLSYAEVIDEVKSAKNEVNKAKLEADKAKLEADKAKLEADKAKKKSALLATKLKELGIDPDSLT